MAEFGRWHAKAWPGVRKRTNVRLPRIELGTYPLEVLSNPEMDATTPLLTGHIPPWRATSAATVLDASVLNFIRRRRLKGDKTILTCRGSADNLDCDLVALANTLTEVEDTSYICQRNQGLEMDHHTLSQKGRILVVRGDLNHDLVLPEVDIIANHGMSEHGTIVTSLKALTSVQAAPAPL